MSSQAVLNNKFRDQLRSSTAPLMSSKRFREMVPSDQRIYMKNESRRRARLLNAPHRIRLARARRNLRRMHICKREWEKFLPLEDQVDLCVRFPTEHQVPDEEVIRAIRSIPKHFANVPTLVQHVSTNNSGSGVNMQHVFLQLANPTLASNCVIIGFSAGSASIATITDSVGTNTWNTINSEDQTPTGNYQRMLASYNTAAGVVWIQFTFPSSPAANSVQLFASEFYNVATSAANDGSNPIGTTTATTAWASGNCATTVDGDLVFVYMLNNTAQYMDSSTAMTITAGWTFLAADIQNGFACAYMVQTTHSATTNVTITSPSSQGYQSIIAGFKQAVAGTAPSATWRVVRKNCYQQKSGDTTLTIQMPADTGNLLVLAFNGAGANNDVTTVINISTITDSKSNAWTNRVALTYTNSAPTKAQQEIWDAGGGGTAPTLAQGLLLTVTLHATNGQEAMPISLFEVLGPSVVHYDTNGSNAFVAPGPNGTHNTFVSITPTTANGLIIVQGDQDFGFDSAFSGGDSTYIWDAPYFTESIGIPQDDLFQDSCSGHIYNATATTYTLKVVNSVDSSGTPWAGKGGGVAVAWHGPSSVPETETHFRFRNDDGSESTATWLAAQDTNISQPILTSTRLREQMDTSGDEVHDSVGIQYRKPDSLDWRNPQ